MIHCTITTKQSSELTEQSGHQSILDLYLLFHEEESDAVGLESSAQLDESELRIHLLQTIVVLPLLRHQSLYPAGLRVLFRQNVGENFDYDCWFVFPVIEIPTHYLNKRK